MSLHEIIGVLVMNYSLLYDNLGCFGKGFSIPLKVRYS